MISTSKTDPPPGFYIRNPQNPLSSIRLVARSFPRRVCFQNPSFSPTASPSTAERGRECLISINQWDEASHAYLLTRLHAHDTQGISSRWARGPIFCTAVSARLFPAGFPDFYLSLLWLLGLGVPHALTLTSPTTGLKVAVCVTAIGACHYTGQEPQCFELNPPHHCEEYVPLEERAIVESTWYSLNDIFNDGSDVPKGGDNHKSTASVLWPKKLSPISQPSRCTVKCVCSSSNSKMLSRVFHRRPA